MNRVEPAKKRASAQSQKGPIQAHLPNEDQAFAEKVQKTLKDDELFNKCYSASIRAYEELHGPVDTESTLFKWWVTETFQNFLRLAVTPRKEAENNG